MLTALLVATPVLVHAGDGFINLVGIPGLNRGGEPNMEEYLNSLLRIAIIAAALVAVIKLILGGAQYVLSDLVTSKENAKRDVYGALIGLLIVLAAVTILRTINPDIMNLEPLTAPPRPELPDPSEFLGDDSIDETAERFSCPGGGEPLQNAEGEQVCVTQEQRNRAVIITADNQDSFQFDSIPYGQDAWADARERQPQLQRISFSQIVGYIEVNPPESNDLLLEYNFDADRIREELMVPKCLDKGGSRVIQVTYGTLRTGYYCVREE